MFAVAAALLPLVAVWPFCVVGVGVVAAAAAAAAVPWLRLHATTAALSVDKLGETSRLYGGVSPGVS